MKQILEEAAREYSSQWAWNSQPDMWQSEKDFKAGVEWQANRIKSIMQDDSQTDGEVIRIFINS